MQIVPRGKEHVRIAFNDCLATSRTEMVSPKEITHVETYRPLIGIAAYRPKGIFMAKLKFIETTRPCKYD